jgi:hypothetical protein
MNNLTTYKQIPHVIWLLLIYGSLQYVLINNSYLYYHTLWIPKIIKLILPGVLTGILILSTKHVILISIFGYIVCRIISFFIYQDIGIGPLYMEIVLYFSMAGYAFAGSSLGFIIKRLYQKFFPNNNRKPIA